MCKSNSLPSGSLDPRSDSERQFGCLTHSLGSILRWVGLSVEMDSEVN